MPPEVAWTPFKTIWGASEALWSPCEAIGKPSGTIWSFLLASSGPLDPSGVFWGHLELLGAILRCLKPSGALWDLLGTIWGHLETSGAIWSNLGLFMGEPWRTLARC